MGVYTLYHCHSDYSLLDSCTQYTDYIDLSLKNGAKALSISEHGKPLNWTEKWAACRAAGLRYIHSVEIYLTEQLEEKIRDNYHTVLMARNMDGVRELNELVSRSCDPDHFYYTNRISFDEFLGLSDNIITTSACLASPLNKLPETHPRYEELVGRYDFLEVQPHNHPDQIIFNQKINRLSNRFGKPLIAGTDTHSSSQYKAECRAILLASKHKSYGDEDAFDLAYKSYDELVESFRLQGALSEKEYLTAIENTNLLYDLTEDIELDTSIKYPILYGSREADEEQFVKRVEEKFKQKLDDGIIPADQETAFRSAIDEEMEVFRKLDMCGFMLSMSELIGWCKDQGFAIGTARGSVGGSRVAYIADIIDLNPETWHTIFSRFCNEYRVEIGDIDIDCVESDRPAIFKHITERFGADKTARVASFGTIKGKAAIDDIGRALADKWKNDHPGSADAANPWSLDKIKNIKTQFDADEAKTKEKYPELFYYYDGLLDTKVSQSVHPAGMVISPITLADNYGVFKKDDDMCLFLDMDNIHDYTGLAKYDFLVLKTVQVIRDTCEYLGTAYPKTHEIDWNDQKVWEDIIKSPAAIFQFEGSFAFDCLKQFRPKNIFDMALVTAAVRPSGTSYRQQLMARRPYNNPSPEIDKLLERNLGYLVYQEDTIAFLQQMCGLSGGEADTVRRAIGRKKREILDEAMPRILEGYCKCASKPREDAEKDAKAFLQIIEDSASYQFGYNHSIAYCLLSYLCAYYRYYHPLEFLTSFLNNAANDDDIKQGTDYAHQNNIRVTMPKWGVSRSDFYFDNERRIISKGLGSIKGFGTKVGERLYALAHERQYEDFTAVLLAITSSGAANQGQIDILINIDFFSDFGNQRELLFIKEQFYETFKCGEAKQIRRSAIAGSPLEPIVQKYAVGVTKSGQPSMSYTLLDINSIMHEAEAAVKSVGMSDLDNKTKMKNFENATGYAGFMTGKEEDRRTLYVSELRPVRRRKDGKQFGYGLTTRSLGSGKEASWTVFNKDYDKLPFKKGDFIHVDGWRQRNGYFELMSYRIV